ncbi:hypothetical protein [Priestia megaterium]|uniref:hypothetical protein n=1 Tax=Priestia megaterium TaxID=1404 RepID=UPI001402C415|nr:hypothetical protein [Priestia megaterium]
MKKADGILLMLLAGILVEVGKLFTALSAIFFISLKQRERCVRCKYTNGLQEDLCCFSI